MSSPQDRRDRLTRLVAAALNGARRPALVLHEPGLEVGLEVAPDGPVVVLPWDADLPVELAERLPGTLPRTVLLLASDLAALRVALPALAPLRSAREHGVVLLDATRPVPVRLGPPWPTVTAAAAVLVDGGAVTRVELAERAPVREVLGELVRGAAEGPTDHRGLRVAGPDPAWWPPVDASVTRGFDPAAERPADVVLAVGADGSDRVGEPSPVTGRGAALVDPGLGALDPAVWTPAAFADPRRALNGSGGSGGSGGSDGSGGSGGSVRRLAHDARLTPGLAADLVGAGTVEVVWPDPVDQGDGVDRAWLRAVAGLALCGVALVAPGPAPAGVRRLLGDPLTDALAPDPAPGAASGVAPGAAPVPDGAEAGALRRARLRRAALGAHAAPAWRQHLAATAGVRATQPPRVETVRLDPARAHGPDLAALVGLAGASEADLLLLDPGAPGPGLDLGAVRTALVALQQATGADAVGVEDVGVEAWAEVGGPGPLVLDRARLRDLEVPRPAASVAPLREQLSAALRAHGATTYAVPPATVDARADPAHGPRATTQPRVRRNEWQTVDVPALGTWEPTLSVSVVVPAYTAGRLLPTVLAGLVAQTYPAHLIEVVVVDDGPVHGELTLPELRPERTRVVRADTPEAVAAGCWGRAHACHMGALAAEGQVIHWLDADMLLERDQVEAQLRWHHRLDHVVTLGTKWFVDADPALARTPAEVRDGVASGEMPSWWDGLERTPHTWVEEIFARTDDLRTIGWNALRCHTGAVAAVGRELYLASGGMDPMLRLGEDIALGGRLAEVGAVFVPDREARSMHLGRTQVMSRETSVNDYNDPFLADRVPMLHAHRRRGRTYTSPYLEVVVDSRGERWADVVATVDAVLASTLTDLGVTLVGDWGELTQERHPVLDRSVDVRIVHETYAADGRVRLVDAPPPAHGPRPAPWRLTLPGVSWAPGRMALERVLLQLEHTHDGLRLLRLPDGSVARIERTAALARAGRTLRPGESLDAVLDQVAGVAELAAGPEGPVRFQPSAQARPSRYARTGGPPVDQAEAWRRVDRTLHPRR